jgi:hypothetical protein
MSHVHLFNLVNISEMQILAICQILKRQSIALALIQIQRRAPLILAIP